MPPNPPDSNPLVIVSNRLPVTVQRASSGLELRRSSGGLVSALDPALASCGGTWVGWPGVKLRPGEHLSGPDDPYQIVPVELSTNEVGRYYHGFSNRTLWPLFHCFTERTEMDRRDWEVYDQVNARFAEAAFGCSEDADLIWIHDYQLMRTPRHLRRLRPDARIGYFLHIPFPPYDVFRLLPWSRELLQGLLAADVIGFHVQGYATNFLACADRMLGARLDPESGLVEHGERTVQVGAFPLGIDYQGFARRAREAPHGKPARERIVLGVDRLDYSKGIPERMRAFARLLELHPEHREKVVLMQVAVPTRHQVPEYQELKREIDELVGRINGRFATSSWSPIRYLYRSIPQDRLVVLYRDADVALVTPLRDGMNLVAKEFVATQVEHPGVLILSRIAGAAETMREAIQVNPYDIDGVAEELHRALEMEEPERRTRMDALQRRESTHDVERWLASFLLVARGARASLQPVTDADFESWLGRFLEGWRLALFLDYDGTLTPIREHPSDATLAAPMRDAIRACAGRSDTDLTLVSGRALADIEKLVDVPDLVFAGNHGLEISGGGLEPFRHEDVGHYQERLAALSEALQEICPPGAWVVEKGASLTVHYRQADPASHEPLAQEARAHIQRAGFQARDASRAVEARPPIGWDKGHAVLHVLRARYGPAWSAKVRVIYLGDDETDEDAFRVLSGLGITMRVGAADHPSLASRSLPNTASVRALLEWLSHR